MNADQHLVNAHEHIELAMLVRTRGRSRTHLDLIKLLARVIITLRRTRQKPTRCAGAAAPRTIAELSISPF
eukprot:1209251-Pleurochrysis_carterae.AAC.2